MRVPLPQEADDVSCRPPLLPGRRWSRLLRPEMLRETISAQEVWLQIGCGREHAKERRGVEVGLTLCKDCTVRIKARMRREEIRLKERTNWSLREGGGARHKAVGECARRERKQRLPAPNTTWPRPAGGPQLPAASRTKALLSAPATGSGEAHQGRHARVRAPSHSPEVWRHGPAATQSARLGQQEDSRRPNHTEGEPATDRGSRLRGLVGQKRTSCARRARKSQSQPEGAAPAQELF